MRPWLVVALVIAGVAAAGLVDDEAARAQKQLEEEQSQDKEALEAVGTGRHQLGGAIEHEAVGSGAASEAPQEGP
jgi:hypothetical protein